MVVTAELHGAQTWLYFRPELAMALAQHRGFELHWGSEQTGGIGATGNGLHFGLNGLGLINIFAKDIAALDPWEQRIWGAQQLTYRSWAIQRDPRTLDVEFWRKRGIEILDVELNDYVGELRARLDALRMSGENA